MSFRFLVVVDKSPDAMSGDFFCAKSKKNRRLCRCFKDFLYLCSVFLTLRPQNENINN